jgi:hypothetical protein
MPTKKGRGKYIETPEILWELFEAYCKHAKSNPFIVTDWVGGAGVKVQRKKERPLTMEGFNLFCYDKISQVKDYFANTGGNYSEYLPICSRIKEAIREDQIGGGMAGIYNPSITQRLNGLVEKVQNDVKVEQGLFPDVKPQ